MPVERILDGLAAVAESVLAVLVLAVGLVLQLCAGGVVVLVWSAIGLFVLALVAYVVTIVGGIAVPMGAALRAQAEYSRNLMAWSRERCVARAPLHPADTVALSCSIPAGEAFSVWVEMERLTVPVQLDLRLTVIDTVGGRSLARCRWEYDGEDARITDLDLGPFAPVEQVNGSVSGFYHAEGEYLQRWFAARLASGAVARVELTVENPFGGAADVLVFRGVPPPVPRLGPLG